MYDKFGFDVPVTYEALDSLLRQSMDLPEGELVNVYIENDRDIVCFRYRRPDGSEFRVGQAGEYPKRTGIVTYQDISPVKIFK